MPIWYVTIYEPDGRTWTSCFRFGEWTEAHKFARKQTHPRGRCSIHTGNPDGAPLFSKVGGNLVEAA